MFFSFDGLDGAGKTTQIELFCQWLRDRGQRVTACRDPGSTPLGDAIRAILLDRHDLAAGRKAEMLLYMAARAQLIDEVIRPALDRKEIVVSDRYLLANVVYQGHAGGLDVASLWKIGEFVTDGLQPDLTFVLDVPPATAAARMRRSLDRMELQGDEYRLRLRSGFLAEAVRQPDKIVVVNAARTIQEVQADVRTAAEKILKPGG